MSKKSKIKTTLDNLFAGGRTTPEEAKAEKERTTALINSASSEKAKMAAQLEEIVPDPKIAEIERVENMKIEEPNPAQNQPIDNQTPEIIELLSQAIQPVSATELPVAPQAKSAEPQLPVVPVETAGEKANPEQLNVAEIDLANRVKVDDDEQLVIFTLGEELYGVTIRTVESIIKIQAITEVPSTAAYVLGVTNLRGTVVPVLDLRKRFSLQFADTTPNTRIIIINADGAKVGIVVDEVTEVLKVAQIAIQPTPPMATTIESAFISGIAKINGRLVILLDLVKVLDASSRQYNR